MTNPTLLGTDGHSYSGQIYDGVNYYSNVGLGRCAMIGTFQDELDTYQIIRAPGTISYLSWRSETEFGTALTLALRQNYSSSALAISIGASTTGWVTDSIDSVTVSSGDALDFATSLGAPGTYSPDFYCVSARFDADTAITPGAQMLATVAAGTLGTFSLNMTPPTQGFVNFLGCLDAGNIAEAPQQFYCLTAGTWQSMACHVESNSFDERTMIYSRKNGFHGHMVINIDAGMTGYFEVDAMTSDSVDQGDLLNYELYTEANNFLTGSLTMDWGTLSRNECSMLYDWRNSRSHV